MLESFGSRLWRLADRAMPLVLGLFLASLVESRNGELSPWIIAAGLGVALASGLALWWRQTRPVEVFAIAFAGGLVVQLIAPDGVFPYAGLVALFALAAARPPRLSLPALGLLLALTALNFRTGPSGDAWFAMAFPVVAWALGEAVRNRRAAIEEASRRAIGEEQARLARELHDVIAHSVSVMVVQASAAGHVFEERPDQARAALASIEQEGRDALGELRRLLAGVRPGAEPEELAPQPGLHAVGDLAGTLRAAGLDVRVRREGDAGDAPIPSGVDLSAYRIVQEALTNTLRHAKASRAEVTLRTAGGVLELDVLDDGCGRGPGGGSGRGLAGMRERAALLGGTLEAGPRPEGGFRVRARLPLEPVR